jgi:glucose/arabinose dehydrogenase
MAGSLAQAVEILLPDGFTATVFHEGLGKARHMAVRDNGDVYVAIRYMLPNPRRGTQESAGGIAALRDENGDGVADRVERFGRSDVDTGIAIHGDWLYYSSAQAVYRVALTDELVPDGTAQLVAGGFPAQLGHAAKPITFDAEGNLYVNSGAPSNSCQAQQRTPGSQGVYPCPQLERSGGIWKFDADKLWQDQLRDGHQYATGSRQIVALEWNAEAGELFFAMHGRDSLDQLFPEHFTMEQRVELPAEEFHVVTDGDDYGWPYTYWDGLANERMVSPEYGGDGKMVSDGEYTRPLIGFPAHWGPNDLVFYTAEQFPARYKGGAFVAFHGSWNRAPLPQGGFNVVFVPMTDGRPSGDWEVFADGFAGETPPQNSFGAPHRPTGLAVATDGSLYISDDQKGRIWKVSYTAD